LIRSPAFYPLLLAVLVGAYWLHALQVPYWQDDFHLLMLAREAREAGDSWLSAFWPAEKSIVWRPLSEGIYWRAVEGLWDSDPLAAHAISLLSLAASALAVAWLVADYWSLISGEQYSHRAFLIAGFVYGIHSAHLLPALWATAVHSSLVVLFSSLALRYWVAALRDRPTGLTPRLMTMPLFLLLALFSKENGILVLPLGALLAVLAWHRTRPTAAVWLVAAISLLIALVWLFLRREVVVPPLGAYEMGVGINTLRNLLAAVLFFFNVPRESLRFILEQHSAIAGIWALSCFALQAVAVWIAAVSAAPRLGPMGLAATAAFFLISLAPYLLFSWNSYAYYVNLGLIVWPFLAAAAPLSADRLRLMLAASLLSSALSVAGNYALDYPALLARADWSERQLELLRDQFPSVAQVAREQGIDVVIENRHKFLGMGPDGIAFTLGLPRQALRELPANEARTGSAVKLFVPDRGDAYFEGITPHEQ